MINPNIIRDHIVSTLATGLPSSLTYHNLAHTLDVEARSMVIAREEGITDEQALLELRIAALYHDCGFLRSYQKHEEKSCMLAREELPFFGLTAEAIENICEIILATRIPHAPKDHMQKIICDADLDYLGRDDYFIISQNLRNEFLEYGIVSDETDWENLTIMFLNSHRYFTGYSQKIREPEKRSRLNYLISKKEADLKINF